MSNTVEVKIFRETAVPSTWEANAIYLIAPPSTPDYVEMYVVSADGTPKRNIKKSDIESMINTAITSSSGMVIVDDIAARDALAPTTVKSVFVKDATADATVEGGYFKAPTTYNVDGYDFILDSILNYVNGAVYSYFYKTADATKYMVVKTDYSDPNHAAYYYYQSFADSTYVDLTDVRTAYINSGGTPAPPLSFTASMMLTINGWHAGFNWATYLYDPAQSSWIKTGEGESLDINTDVSWDDISGKPNVSKSAIEQAVANNHKHTNLSQLNKIGEDASGNLLYNGSLPATGYSSSSW